MSATEIQHIGEQQVESAAALELLNEIFRGYPASNFAVRLWDGTLWNGAMEHPLKPGLETDPGRDARFTLVIHSPEALQSLLEEPSELALGEAYIYGDFDVEGDIEAVMPLVDYLLGREYKIAERLRLRRALRRLRPATPNVAKTRHFAKRGLRHSIGRDRRAVRYHYDVSNDFYRLWLDRRMVYSSAEYGPNDDLDAAQLRKLDSICQMLQLREGDRFLDIGCGWGGLIMHAARNYGANALGITLSKVQAQLAEAEIHKARLSKLCRVLVKDYRELGQKEIFDKIASIGMVEHVGSNMLGEFLTRVHKALRPGGLFLLSGITLPMQRLASAASKSFVDEYVFPDGELLPVSLMAREAERAGFEIKFVRSMREHYARTLRDWVHRLEEHAEQARRLTSEVTYRTWRLYMAGSAYRFTQGALNIHQMLLAKAE